MDNYKTISERVAQLIKETRMAHEQVKNRKAELVAEAMDNPTRCAGSKATLASIESYYRLDSTYQKLKQNQIQCEFLVDSVIQNLKTLEYEKGLER